MDYCINLKKNSYKNDNGIITLKKFYCIVSCLHSKWHHIVKRLYDDIIVNKNIIYYPLPLTNKIINK